jgi:hypothetical protein
MTTWPSEVLDDVNSIEADDSCIEMCERVNWDVSFRESGAQAVREFNGKAPCP